MPSKKSLTYKEELAMLDALLALCSRKAYFINTNTDIFTVFSKVLFGDFAERVDQKCFESWKPYLHCIIGNIQDVERKKTFTWSMV